VAVKRKTRAQGAADKANGDAPRLQIANFPAAIATAITTINLTAEEIAAEILLPIMSKSPSQAAQIARLKHCAPATEIVRPPML
jgi:hypothetical protein